MNDKAYIPSDCVRKSESVGVWVRVCERAYVLDCSFPGIASARPTRYRISRRFSGCCLLAYTYIHTDPVHSE